MSILEHVARRYRRAWLLVALPSWLVGAWGAPFLARESFPLFVLIHASSFVIAPFLGQAAARRAIARTEPGTDRWILHGRRPMWTFTSWAWYAPWLGLTLLLPVLSYAGYLALPMILISWFAHWVFWLGTCLENAKAVAILRRELASYRSYV